jgi:HTH-type transcriptional regulator / antitoxin HigA
MKATLVIVENDTDHQQAKALVQKLMNSVDPSDQSRLVAQARLIEAYEQGRWPRRTPTLPEILTYLMDQHGLTRADLAELLGTPSRVSEVMTGKRELSMSMVRKVRDRFHVSADVLIGPTRLRKHLAA